MSRSLMNPALKRNDHIWEKENTFPICNRISDPNLKSEITEKRSKRSLTLMHVILQLLKVLPTVD